MTVSVVIPTRNRASRVGTAIWSALDQTLPDLEVIVVDDASDDETPDVVAEIARGDDRLTVVRREERGGAARARNAGVESARGSIVAFLDDDCAWHPRKLELQLTAMGARHGVGYARQATRDVDGRWIVEGRPVPSGSPLDGLLRTNFIGSPSLVVQRELFQEVGGFDERLPRLQDWDLVLRLARRSTFAYVPEVLVHSVMLPGGISTAPEGLRRAAEHMVERHAAHLGPRRLGALCYGLGKFLLVDGETAAARDFFRRSIRLDPSSALNWAGFGAALLGPVPARLVRRMRRMRGASTFRGVQPGEFRSPAAPG